MKLPTATALALIAGLAGCASSPEERVETRQLTWARDCGYFTKDSPLSNGKWRLTDKGARLWNSDESDPEYVATARCIDRHEQAYQNDRALAVERGTAMMGPGTTLMMTTPGYNATPAPAYVEPDIGMGPGPAGSYYNPATPYAPAYVPPGIGMGPGPAGSYYNPSTTPAGR
jgi:hypothetical protein